MTRDTLFKTEEIKRGGFSFDEKTANVFDDMLNRSVPFYGELQRMIVELTRHFLCPYSKVYDIGCSTGTTLSNLSTHLDLDTVQLIGIDSSEAMLDKARRKKELAAGCAFVRADLNDHIEINNGSVVIMSLTLQFVRPEKRHRIISQIHDGLRENGALILIEKIVSQYPLLSHQFGNFYQDFKKRNHYSDLEISRKKEALDGVLIPFTYDQNLTLLRDSGFKTVDCFFRWYNFCGLLAVKTG